MSNNTVFDGGKSHIDHYKAYMTRVGKEKIPFYEPVLGDQEIEFLSDVIRRNWLSENKYVREFESRLANLCQRTYAMAFCNCTSAMIAGMKALRIGQGDEVIVPSFSHPADPNSIAATGAIPVFADVDEKTLCLSVETIDTVKTSKTKGILLVSLYGNAPEMTGIINYAKKNNLFLIHDCAGAFCSTYKGKPLAAYGDFSALSFFADKTITTGEGGMLLADDINLINESNMFKHDGRKERGIDVIERRGYNFRMTELQAAVGVAQLNKLKHIITRKKEILKEYKKQLSGTAKVKVFNFNSKGEIVPHRILIFVPNAMKIIEHLTSLGVGARTTYMPMHSQPCYNVKKNFPVTEKLYATGVSLPSAPSLTQADIDFVCSSIKNFYGGDGKK